MESKIKLIFDKLSKEGKVTTIPRSAFAAINKEMEHVRREFILKQERSEEQASKIYLD